MIAGRLSPAAKLSCATSTLDVWSRDLMVQYSPSDGGMHYGPGSSRERPHDSGEIRQLIVEAMGFAADGYLAAKAVTHPRVRLIAPVLPISAEDADHGAVRAMLSAALLSEIKTRTASRQTNPRSRGPLVSRGSRASASATKSLAKR